MRWTNTKSWLVIYSIAATVYLTEVFGEITGYRFYKYSWEAHEAIELLAVLGFLLGGYLLWRNHRQLCARNAEVERHLRAAQGEFFKMVQARFDHWGFTEAEKDIALLTIKGMTVAEIAALRKTSEGTIKSQNNSIYRKAEVRSRTQLLGTLIDELLVDTRAVPFHVDA